MRELKAGLLWLGNAREACEFTKLLECGIRAIVQLAYEEPPITPPRELVYLRFPLLDCGENDPKMLLAAIHAVAELLQAEIPALVCCSLGMNRSPAITAAALSLKDGLLPEQSLKAIAISSATDISPQLWDEICKAMKM